MVKYVVSIIVNGIDNEGDRLEIPILEKDIDSFESAGKVITLAQAIYQSVVNRLSRKK